MYITHPRQPSQASGSSPSSLCSQSLPANGMLFCGSRRLKGGCLVGELICVLTLRGSSPCGRMSGGPWLNGLLLSIVQSSACCAVNKHGRDCACAPRPARAKSLALFPNVTSRLMRRSTRHHLHHCDGIWLHLVIYMCNFSLVIFERQ